MLETVINKIKSVTKKSLFKSSSVYTISTIVERAIPFLLLPILTRYLSTEEYGIVSMFMVIVGLTSPFVGLNSHSAILRSYFKEKVDIPLYVYTALIIMFTSTGGVLFIFIAFSDFISKYTGLPESWLTFVVYICVGQFLINVLLNVWRAQKKALEFGIYKIFLSTLNVGMSVLLVVGFGYGWEGRVIGMLYATCWLGIISVYLLYSQDLIKFDYIKGYFKHAISYSVPLIPHILASYIITTSDRLFITNMVGIEETGIYTVGYKIGMIIQVLAISFDRAWVPWVFDNLSKAGKEAKRKIVKFTYSYFITIVLLAISLSFLASWFMKYLVAESFYIATSYVPWVAVGYAFQGMHFMTLVYILYEEKTHYLSILTFTAAVTNLGLNYLLISINGAIGAAQATFITYIILFLFTAIIAFKLYEMPWLKVFSRTPT